MAKSNRGKDPKPIDVTGPSDLPPADLKPIEPRPVDVVDKPRLFVSVSVPEAMALWWKWWWSGKALDALEGRPADLLPSIGKIHSIIKWGLIALSIVVVGGVIAWIAFRFF